MIRSMRALIVAATASACSVVACGSRSGLFSDEPAADAGTDISIDAPRDVEPAPLCTVDTDCPSVPFCTGDRHCAGPPLYCQIIPRNCDDGIACTRDTCDDNQKTCVHTPDDSLCPAGEHCDGTTGCDRFAYAVANYNLYDVRLPSGQVKKIGTGSFLSFASDIALALDSTLYATEGNSLDTVDRVTAKLTIGPTITPHDHEYNALDVAPNGTMYGAAEDDGSLVSIDVKTGWGTFVASYPNGYSSSGDIAVVGGRVLATARTSHTDPNDVLVEFDLVGKTSKILGPTGYRCVWGLAAHGPLLYGFTCQGLLVQIDTTTGAGATLASGGPPYTGASSR
jgi:hypothetical protein